MKNKKIIVFWITVVSIAFLFSVLTIKDNSFPSLFKKESLPTVGSYDNFKSIMKEVDYQNNGGLKGEMMDYFSESLGSMQSGMTGSGGAMTSQSMPFNAASKGVSNSALESATSSDYSKTNIQVEGVDEGDIIKTDGKYIYQLTRNNLIISKVTSAEKMEVVYKETFENYQPLEMYVDDENLVVIGGTNSDYVDDRHFYYGSFPQTQTFVYELKERHNLNKIREMKVDGDYLSSRKIKDDVYIITNKHIYTYRGFEESPFSEGEKIRPMFYDSVTNKEMRIDWKDIRYIPTSKEKSFLIVSSLSLANENKEINVETYLGAGNIIYASQDNLYVAKENYDYGYGFNSENNNENTDIYKFKLDNGKVFYDSKGNVKGRLLNQFSMDEHNGYFRVATTIGEVWNEVHKSTNNLFVLDKDLKIVGQINDIASGEKIYSMRFLGDRGYMVTFKKVDPLFVIDLKEPMNPKILGKLKIPGYSDYLHPYDENHIIGFGKDTEEAYDGNFAYYQGLKMALFDVSDVNNPKEKFVEIIGDRGTESELLYNHKALLFSKEKNIIAFPVRIAEIQNGQQNEFNNEYGSLAFDGAVVYDLDLKNGFTLKKRISHYSDEDWMKMGDYSDGSKSIHRLLYIDNDLYTISDEKIKSHNMKNYELKGELNILSNEIK